MFCYELSDVWELVFKVIKVHSATVKEDSLQHNWTKLNWIELFSSTCFEPSFILLARRLSGNLTVPEAAEPAHHSLFSLLEGFASKRHCHVIAHSLHALLCRVDISTFISRSYFHISQTVLTKFFSHTVLSPSIYHDHVDEKMCRGAKKSRKTSSAAVGGCRKQTCRTYTSALWCKPNTCMVWSHIAQRHWFARSAWY